MKKSIYLLFALLAFAVELPAQESRLAPETEPLALSHGCVHVVTGEFVQQEADLVLEGSSPLIHSRIYDSGNSNAESSIGYGFTRAIARSISGGSHDKQAKCCYAFMEEREGARLHYCGRYKRGKEDHPIHFRVSDFILDKGYSNYSPYGINGTYSLHNVRLIYKNQRWFQGGNWEVTLGCGTKRIYQVRPGYDDEFDLTEEIRPNGNRVIYKYDHERRLSQVYVTDEKKQTPLMEYSVGYGEMRVVTKGSNGKTLNYKLERNFCDGVNLKAGYRWKTRHPRLTIVEGDHLVKTTYTYARHAGEDDLLGKVIKISHPEGRELHIAYHKGTARVKGLSGPVGNDRNIHTFATFQYPQRGVCDIYGPYQEHTRILIDTKTHRITHKQLWLGENLHSQTRYFWINNGPQSGNLVTKALCDGSGTARSSTRLFYDDERGNVTKEILYGNLSGTAPASHSLGAMGEPQSPIEGYATERTYHPIFNTLLTEKGDDGLFTEYRYYAGTNLLRLKLVGGSTRLSREFFTYDGYANLTRYVVDNGTGDVDYLHNVTVRTITEIEPIVTPLSVAFGKPSKKREKYWENGQEHLLRTTHYFYNEHGYPFHENIHDAQDVHRYTLQRKYDAAGRVLEEVNAVGQKTLHTYDPNGNKVLTVFVDQEIHVESLYDFSNRLIEETESHPYGQYVTTHKYDHSSRKIATIDPFGNETLYTYNDLDQLIAITHPKVNGQRGVEWFEYDIAGNKTAVYDVLGHVTRTTYTARGQPALITYPDGSQESYQYNGNGSLRQHTAVNGVTERIYYDAYLRPVTKAFFDANDQHLYSTIAAYQGSHVISETDASGIETQYRYDGAGRLVETRKGNQRTQHSYDSLGHQYMTTEWADDCTARITTYEYDLLDRIIEERVRDLSGVLYSCDQYAYDSRGNRCLHVTETSLGTAITETKYDTRNRPIWHKDALGHVTTTQYEEDFVNGIQRTTVTDPLNNQTLTTLNSVGQCIEESRKDAQGQLRAQSTYVYDLAGHKIQQRDTVMATGLPDRTVVTEWVYDSMGRVIKLTEAVGTLEQKCTSYTFNLKGQKETIFLPDNIELHHTYDPLGRLEHYSASDQSFDYLYTYDLNNNVVSVLDKLTQAVIRREYDTNNRMTTETLASALALRYSYDGLGRLLHVTLPDNSGVAYTYDAVHLKEVSRISERPYQHQYTLYDLSGALLEEISPIGEIFYTWDLLQRPREIRSFHFTETIPEQGYDAVGNLLEKTRQDMERTTHGQYTYDPLYQLCTETVTGFDQQEYLYDSLHNRRLRNKQEQVTNHLNQLLSTGETTYTYDKRGNLISEETPTTSVNYGYDAMGRLTSLTRDGKEFRYQYDSFNRRLKKTSELGEEFYLYIDKKEVGKVEQNKIVQLRVLGQGKGAEIGSAIALELDDKIYIPIHDHSGHVSVLIDLETQSFAEGYAYTAFGEEQRYGFGTTNPWRFSSKRHDPESGWIYFGRRYYDPVTGRWTTPDPIGFTDGPNLYAYVKNNPLTHFDPYGLFICYDFHKPDALLSSRPVSPTELLGYPRVQGALQALSGVTEVSLGCGLAAGMGWTGAGALLGGFMVAQGMDHYTAGMATVFSGTSQSTLAAQGLQKCGLSPAQSHMIDNSVSIVATAGAGALLKSLQQAAPMLGKSASHLTPKNTNLAPALQEVQPPKIYKPPVTKKLLPEGHMWQEFSPFKNKTAQELHEMFRKKGYDPVGDDAMKGLGSYLDEKKHRMYRIDPRKTGRYDEPNHIDVFRSKGYLGPLKKKRFSYLDD